MKVYVISILLLFLCSIIEFVLLVCQSKKIKIEKAEYKRLSAAYNGIKNELMTVIEVNKIRDKNEKKANEKINDLQSGKLSNDDILPKRKS